MDESRINGFIFFGVFRLVIVARRRKRDVVVILSGFV